MEGQSETPTTEDGGGPLGKADTAGGTAPEGGACLQNPTYVHEKCKPGLVCNAAAMDEPGVCWRVGDEGDACDPAFADDNCESGLSCVETEDGLGFCHGDGTGLCDPDLENLDCAPGYTCARDYLYWDWTDYPDPLQPAHCRPDGTEGTSCDTSLVENNCAEGFFCHPIGSGNSGVCTSKTTGVGSPCEPQSAKKCFEQGLVCAASTKWPKSYACKLPSQEGQGCTRGIYGDHSCAFRSLVTGKSLKCYVSKYTGSWPATGVCLPIAGYGEACSVAVNNCGYDASGLKKLKCISGRCRYG